MGLVIVYAKFSHLCVFAYAFPLLKCIFSIFSNLTISYLYLLKLYPVQECCSHVTSFLKPPQLPSCTALLAFHSPVMTSAFRMVILQIYHPIPHYSSLVPRQHCKFKPTFILNWNHKVNLFISLKQLSNVVATAHVAI